MVYAGEGMSKYLSILDNNSNFIIKNRDQIAPL